MVDKLDRSCRAPESHPTLYGGSQEDIKGTSRRALPDGFSDPHPLQNTVVWDVHRVFPSRPTTFTGWKPPTYSCRGFALSPASMPSAPILSAQGTHDTSDKFKMCEQESGPPLMFRSLTSTSIRGRTGLEPHYWIQVAKTVQTRGTNDALGVPDSMPLGHIPVVSAGATNCLYYHTYTYTASSSHRLSNPAPEWAPVKDNCNPRA
ncbi:hypothetical protein DFH07DRAFT_767566 [Mycena maculata]|uniref:Uncharacterized protein n=1 Tax=Mycena maculata TaxID=230809 RepID=A0AAD7JX89_9AGAR|nr:hypothetical protein DFH07DRAFT_767566 [Mycena maculata]